MEPRPVQRRPDLPPGWPRQVQPPQADGFRRTALAWLLDQCPPDYRSHDVLRRHPVALAFVAVHHLAAALEGCRRAQGAVRAALREEVSPPVLEEVIEALDAEEARLSAAARAADLVARALRGERYVPRL